MFFLLRFRFISFIYSFFLLLLLAADLSFTAHRHEHSMSSIHEKKVPALSHSVSKMAMSNDTTPISICTKNVSKRDEKKKKNDACAHVADKLDGRQTHTHTTITSDK